LSSADIRIICKKKRVKKVKQEHPLRKKETAKATTQVFGKRREKKKVHLQERPAQE